MALRLIEAPVAWPVTLAEIKAHCRISGSAEDALLGALLAAATEQAGAMTRRQLVTATWALALDRFPSGMNRAAAIEIPLPPLQSIDSITYVDADGVGRTMLSGAYVVDLDSEPGLVFPAHDTEWPDTLEGKPNAVTLTFTAGWEMDASTSPAAWTGPDSIKTWIKTRVATLYEHREALEQVASANLMGELPHSFVNCLLDAWTIPAGV